MVRDVLLRAILVITIFSLLLLGRGVEGRPSLEEVWRGKVGSLSLTSDLNGYPWVVWEERGLEGIDSKIYFAFWDGRGWSVPQLVASASGGHAPAIAFDGLRRGWLVWNEGGGLFYSRRDGDTWSPKREIDTSLSTRDRSPSLAVDPQGVLWLAWSGFDGIDEEIFFSRWGEGGWEKAQRVNRDDASPDLYDGSPCLAIGGDGQPWLVWVGNERGLDDDIFYSRWEGEGWSGEGLVSADDSSSDLAPTLAIDGRGRPWVAWSGEYDGKSGVLYSRWEGDGWSPESLVDMPSSLLGGGEPALAMGPRGEPRLAWTAYDMQGSYIAYSQWEGSGWGRPQEIAREGLPVSPALIVGEEETPYILWIRSALSEEALLGQRVGLSLRPLEGAVPGGAPMMAALVSDRYVAFGDSITYGGYAPISYPVYEEMLLDANIAPSDVLNLGVPGEWTRDGKVRIINVMNTYNPEFVLVMEGTNDISHYICCNEIIGHLGVIIDQIKVRGGKPVIATLPPRKDDKEDETEEVNEMIRGYLAPMKRIPVADVWQAIENYPNWKSYYYDERHPTGPLMEVIAQAFYNAMVAWPYIYEDNDPPSSQVNDLAACQTDVNFLVSWSGDDGHGTGIVSYDIQYKDGEGGWVDWLTDTASSWATFPGGQRGHTYYFRSRAEDRMGYVEDWPASPDTSTFMAYAVSGRVWNNRDLSVLLAEVGGSPHCCLDVHTNYLGNYALPFTMTGTVAITVTHSDFGVLPPMYGVEVPEEEVTGVDFWLPSPDDVVTNGQFEENLSSGWSYSEGVQVITDTVHTGLQGVHLSGTSSLSQTVTITPTAIYSPTLSLMYIFELGDPGDSFEVQVDGTSVWSGSQTSSWSHVGVGLSGYSGEVEISFILQQTEAAPPSAYLDEVSLGSAGQAPDVVFLPFIVKEHE